MHQLAVCHPNFHPTTHECHEARKPLLLQDEAAVYSGVMSAVGNALTGAASPLLAPDRIGQLDYEGEDEEFGLLLAETMASFGSGHLAALSPEKKILFLQQASSSPPFS